MSESKVRFTVANPSPTSVSLAEFLNIHPETSHLEITPEIAQAVRMYFSEWQQSPEREAERKAEKQMRAEQRAIEEGAKLASKEAKLREQLAKIEAAKAAESA